MANLSQLNDSLVAALHLAQPPVAICLTESVPAGVETWSGSAPAGCRFWQEAATKTFATSARDHDLCSIGIHTHNLGQTAATEADLGLALKVMGDLGYVRAEDIPQIPVLAKSPKYVIYGPLATIPLTPDVVLLFVQANQTLILSEATQQIESGNPPAMGRPACAIVSQAKNSGRAALSLGCCGARAYLDVLTDDVALYAIPGDKLEQFTERIVALAQANDILTKFHTIRRSQVEAGGKPSVEESLQAMGA